MASKQKVTAPPWSQEAEQAVLGAILLRPAVLNEVADILTTSDFYREANGQDIFSLSGGT